MKTPIASGKRRRTCCGALPVDLEHHVAPGARTPLRSTSARCRSSCRAPRRSRGTRRASSIALERAPRRRSGTRARPPRPGAARAWCTRSTELERPARRAASSALTSEVLPAPEGAVTMKRLSLHCGRAVTRGSAPARASARSAASTRARSRQISGVADFERERVRLAVELLHQEVEALAEPRRRRASTRSTSSRCAASRDSSSATSILHANTAISCRMRSSSGRPSASRSRSARLSSIGGDRLRDERRERREPGADRGDALEEHAAELRALARARRARARSSAARIAGGAPARSVPRRRARPRRARRASAARRRRAAARRRGVAPRAAPRSRARRSSARVRRARSPRARRRAVNARRQSTLPRVTRARDRSRSAGSQRAQLVGARGTAGRGSALFTERSSSASVPRGVLGGRGRVAGHAADHGCDESQPLDRRRRMQESQAYHTVDAAQANLPLPEGYQLQRLPHQRSAGHGRLLHRLPRARRQRHAGRDQGVPAGLARAAPRGRRRCRSMPEENLAAFRYGMKCFFEEGRALAPAVAPERGARAELLPRQRDRLPRDALRARPHPAGAHPRGAAGR